MTTERVEQTMFQIASQSESWDEYDDDDRSSNSNEGERFSDDEDSWRSITPNNQSSNAEFGFDSVSPPPRRKMETMGIMMGTEDGQSDNHLSSCCNRFWYLWLCGGVVAASLLLAYDGMRQYQKQMDLLHGGANGLDDFDIAQCDVFNGDTLEIVEKHLNQVNDTSLFCQKGVS
jgi:hypothetical protein